tara:strand:+ start:1862 stop:4084 length:2223 start_codon:yes stop_codon:yes gene_type:complete
VVNENGYNDPPVFSFVLPDQTVTVATPELVIQWTDSDPDSAASIDLYYRAEGGERTLIVAELSEDLDGEADQYRWNASVLPPGSYRISADLFDGETLVTVEGCCEIQVPYQDKSLSITALSPLQTDETGTAWVEVEVSLDQPLLSGSSLTLNYALSDSSEAQLVGPAWLYFSADTWDQPQTIRIKGADDCEIDGDQSYSLMFQPVASDDDAYSGYLPTGLTLVNSDNELLGQTLFICHYQLLSQTPVAGTELVDYAYQAQLSNRGQSLQSADASLNLLASNIPAAQGQLISGGGLSFGEIMADMRVASPQSFVLRYPVGQALETGRLDWMITPGPVLAVLEGTEGNNSLQGGADDDVMEGKGGNDSLYGGAGNDTLIGGSGSDSLYGEAGDDLILISGDDFYADRVYGGSGYDVIQGGSGDDAIRLATIKDVEKIDGQGGNNAIYGTSGSDTLDFSQVELVNIDFIDALAGNDVLYGSADSDILIGNSGSDILYGNGGDDFFIINGSDSGADRVNGGDGFDRVLGGTDDDNFRFANFSGSNRVEIIDGSLGVNRIEGTSGSNRLDFSETELIRINRIDGLAGNDVLTGSPGNDVIVGGDGSDYLYGGPGDDRFMLSSADSGFDRYQGGDGTDQVIGTVLDDEIRIAHFSGVYRVEKIDGGGGLNRILGSTGSNTLDFRDTELIGIANIDGGAGNDVIYGSSAADLIVGGEGSDSVYGEGGDDRFLVSAGDTGYDRYQGGD